MDIVCGGNWEGFCGEIFVILSVRVPAGSHASWKVLKSCGYFQSNFNALESPGNHFLEIR